MIKLNKIPKDVKHLCTILKRYNHTSVIAGGAVRDLIIGDIPNDWDIVTNAVPDAVEIILNNEGIKTISVGKSFGVIVAVLNNNQYEISTFRADRFSSISDGRRPDSVTFGTMEEDAKRRDLTINGLFLDPFTGNVYDFVDGLKDINNKRIRLIGNPRDRIREDYLRILRVLRFSIKYDWSIHVDTSVAIKEEAKNIETVSKERIADELLKSLRCNGSLTLLFWEVYGLLDILLPEVSCLKNFSQPPEYHPEGDVFRHTQKVLDNIPYGSSDTLILSALLHDVGKAVTYAFKNSTHTFHGHAEEGVPISESVLRRFKFSNEIIDNVTDLVRCHMVWKDIKKMRTSKLKRFMQKDNFKDHIELHRADCLGSNKNLSNYDYIRTIKFEPEEIKPDPILSGQDLINMGYIPGPLFKKILNAVVDEQLEGRVLDKESAIAFVRNNFSLSLSKG